MANRKISEFIDIPGAGIDEDDLLTLVHVIETDPALRNKKITFTEFKNYLNSYYPNGAGGTFSGNVLINANLTVTGQSTFQSVTVSGLSTFSGIVVQNNAIVSGTLSGATITGNTLQVGTSTTSTGTFTTLVTGATANFTSGNFTSLNGTTVTGTNSNFTTGTFGTVTGNTLQGVSGVFQNVLGTVLSGTTVTGTTANFTSGNFISLSGTSGSVSSLIVVDSLVVPDGTTAERPVTPLTGNVRFNTTIIQFEGYNGTAWGTIGGGAKGGGVDQVFFENDQIVTTNYTLTSGKNAVSAGTITIASGITVTIPSGVAWVVV